MIIDERINAIKGKIEGLIERNKKLLAEKEQLTLELTQVKAAMEQKENFIKELENKTVNLQITSTVDNEEKNKLKIKIEEYIAEIDKALELLKS
jgi:hypothetical protein